MTELQYKKTLEYIKSKINVAGMLEESDWKNLEGYIDGILNTLEPKPVVIKYFYYNKENDTYFSKDAFLTDYGVKDINVATFFYYDPRLNTNYTVVRWPEENKRNYYLSKCELIKIIE